MDNLLKNLRTQILSAAPAPFRVAAQAVRQLNQPRFQTTRPNAPRMVAPKPIQMPKITLPKLQMPQPGSLQRSQQGFKLDLPKLGSQVINSPLGKTIANSKLPIAPQSVNNYLPTIGQYVKGQIATPYNQLANMKNSGTDRAIGGLQLGFNATPIGTAYNVGTGIVAGGLKGIREGKDLKKTISQSVANPSDIGGTGLGQSGIAALGIDLLAGNPKGVVKQLKNLKNAKGLIGIGRNQKDIERQLFESADEFRNVIGRWEQQFGSQVMPKGASVADINLVTDIEGAWKKLKGGNVKVPSVDRMIGDIKDAYSGINTQLDMASRGIKLGIVGESKPAANAGLSDALTEGQKLYMKNHPYRTTMDGKQPFVPKTIEQLAKDYKTPDEFVNAMRSMKDQPSEVVQEFFKKYNVKSEDDLVRALKNTHASITQGGRQAGRTITEPVSIAGTQEAMPSVGANPTTATSNRVAQPTIGNVNMGGMNPASLTKAGAQLVDSPQSLQGLEESSSLLRNGLSNSKTAQRQLLQTVDKGAQGQISQPYDDIIAQARKTIGETKQKPGKNLSETASSLYTDWVDRFHPITKLSKIAEDTVKGQKAQLRPEANPRYLLKRFLGMGGIAQQRFDSEFKPILSQIDNLGIDKTDVDAYLKARRDIGFGSVGRNITGSDPVQAAKVAAAYEAKHPELSKVADQLYSYQAQGFDELVKAGFLNVDQAATIKRLNPDYAPFERVMDEVDNYLGMPSQTVQQATSPLKKLKGSERQILSPIESMIANTFKQRAAIEKNNVAKSIVGLGDVIGEKFTTSPTQTDNTIAVWENGKKAYYDVGNEIARSVKGMNEEQSNTLLKILSAPSSWLRAGATGKNPDFMIPNVIRDQFEAAINSKYGYVPVVDYLRGFAHVAKNDDIYQQWKMSGAAQSFDSLAGRKQIKELFNEKTAKKNLIQWLDSGLKVMGKYSEEPTRVGLFNKALNKTGNPLLATMESRESTLDFARMGAKMKVANSIIPFLNVGIQGLDKLVRTGKSDPKKLMVAAGLYGVAPTVATTLYNTFYHPEEYKEIPQYVKDANFVLITGRNEDGTVNAVKIPKASSLQTLTNPIENFISYAADTSQSSLSQMVTQFLSSALPVVGDGSSLNEVALKTIGGNTPQAFKPLTENLLNKSFFKYSTKNDESKEIVPTYMKKKAPSEQTYAFTPALYQKIGQVLNVSPLQVQNLAEGYAAGFVKTPTQIMDAMLAIGRGEAVDTNKLPLLRRFMQTTYPSSGSGAVDVTPKEPVKGLFGQSVNASTDKGGKVPLKIKYTTESGGTTTIDIGKVKELHSTNKYDEATKKAKSYGIAGQIMDAPISKEEKEKYLKEVGISYNEANYYNIAQMDNNEKSSFVTKQLDALQNKNVTQKEFLTYLENLRKSVNGSRIASDGVVDNLVTDGYIPKDVGAQLKKLKPEKAGGGYKAKKAKKPKQIKYKMYKEKPIKLKKIKPLKFKAMKSPKLKIGKRKKVK